MISAPSRRTAGILLVVFPTVLYGGLSLLLMLVGDSRYMQNPLRQNLFRAGHAHAGVLLVLSLVALRYVDEAHLPWYAKGHALGCAPRQRSSCPWPFSSPYCRRKPRTRTP